MPNKSKICSHMNCISGCCSELNNRQGQQFVVPKQMHFYFPLLHTLQNKQLEEVKTQKSAMTHAGTVFMTHDLDPKIKGFRDQSWTYLHQRLVIQGALFFIYCPERQTDKMEIKSPPPRLPSAWVNMQYYANTHYCVIGNILHVHINSPFLRSMQVSLLPLNLQFV